MVRIMLIDIALATYNGEKYIQEMLNSISNQTYQDFMIHLRDDGSTDNTLTLCENHKLYEQGKLKIYKDNIKGLGASKNFLKILGHCNSEYIFLCDQDDFWMKDKIQKMLDHIQKHEYKNNIKVPTLVFSDLQIVDRSLNIIADSFYRNSIKSSMCSSPFDFLLSNHIPGCAMVVNKSLLESIQPLPENFRMHDWWLAFVASFYGKIAYLDEPLIKYRQHGGNTVGVPGMNINILRQIKSVLNFRDLLDKGLLHKKKMEIYIDKTCSNKILSYESNRFYDFLKGNMPFLEKNKIFKQIKFGEPLILSYLVWLFL